MAINWDNVEFKNEKRYLSNMFPCEVKFDSKSKIAKRYGYLFNFNDFVYGSSEHLYQALKSNHPNWHKLIRETKNPHKTKTMARKFLTKDKTLFDGEEFFQIRKDWEEVKLEAMELVLYLKFSQNKDLLLRLKEEELPLVEKNDWNDTFWGVYKGKGANHLGKLLEKIREEL